MIRAPFRCDFDQEGEGQAIAVSTHYFLIEFDENNPAAAAHLALVVNGEKFADLQQVIESRYGALDVLGEEGDLVSLRSCDIQPNHFAFVMRKCHQLFADEGFSVSPIEVTSPDEYQRTVKARQDLVERAQIAAIFNADSEELAPPAPSVQRPRF